MLENENSCLETEKEKGKVLRYEVEQHNGQRRYGPPIGWTGPPPPKGTEIYVTGLAKHYTEKDVVPLFERVAKIYCLRIMMDFRGECRGFCYVRYMNPLDAKRAIKMFDGYRMELGVVLKVVKSSDNCRLFIGKIPTYLTKEKLYEVFSNNTDGLLDVILYKCPYNKNLNRGYCFLEYDSHKSAALARRLFLNEGISDFDFVFLVDWALPEPEIDPEIFNTVTIMYVRNLMAQTSENSIRIALSKFVCPEFITRVKKINDFAFVHFTTHEITDFAIQKFNGYVLDGAVLEVMWAKPTHYHRTSVVGTQFEGHAALAPTIASSLNNDVDVKVNGGVSPDSKRILNRKNNMRNNFSELAKSARQLLMIYPPSKALEILVSQWYDKDCLFHHFTNQSFSWAQVVISKNDVVEFTWPVNHFYPANDSIQAREVVSRAFFEHFILQAPSI